MKRCLFGNNVNKRKFRFVKHTQFTMQLQRRRKGTTTEERRPNAISSYRYVPFKTNGNHSIREWSADTLRFLIHNCTGSYNVCSLLWFVKKGDSIIDYHNAKCVRTSLVKCLCLFSKKFTSTEFQ